MVKTTTTEGSLLTGTLLPFARQVSLFPAGRASVGNVVVLPSSCNLPYTGPDLFPGPLTESESAGNDGNAGGGHSGHLPGGP